VNCPFDTQYQRLFHALVFTIHECGFWARCALEVENSGEERIRKIKRIIRECRYGIHDISRVELDTVNHLPRFNMPLELGIFMGAKEFGSREQKRKAAVILDSEQYRYQRFLSDIAGQDIRAHAGQVFGAIAHVRNFLGSHSPSSRTLPGPERIALQYSAFRNDLPHLCAALHLNPAALVFLDFTRVVAGYVEREGATILGGQAA
jgi:hypothetical protein